tara:strand:- start:939 stop:1190 length:252 start_codon:yes stop_codon:yes gene_type:complete
MATKIVRSANKGTEIMTEIMQCLETQVDNGYTPGDIVHALTFLVVLHQRQFGWSTESILQLYEEYVTKLNEVMNEEQQPYGEA